MRAMEIRINAALLGVVGLAWAGITASSPVASLDPAAPETAELARLEDDFATHRSDSALARDLADHYLALERPALAVSTLSAADPIVRRDPAVLHLLAQAFEANGRVPDALATARLAQLRCARALGSRESSGLSPVPDHGCSEGQLAALRVHVAALATMASWGVQEPTRDERSLRAYAVATRRARIVQANLDDR